jgi:hypothetical protein
MKLTCAFCGRPAQGEFSVHRDGFSIGPEVDLCNDCGGRETPTLAEMWRKIAQPSSKPGAFNRLSSQGTRPRGPEGE